MSKLIMKRKANAAFTTDRDEKGEAKTPENLEVPRLAAKKKKEAEPALEAPPVAPVPPTPPSAPLSSAPSPNPSPSPSNGSVNPIDYIPTETLIKVIGDLPKEEDFAQNKGKQDALIELTNILKVRPILEPEQPKGQQAPPAASAPAINEPVIPAPVKASAQVSLGGLTIASYEKTADDYRILNFEDNEGIRPDETFDAHGNSKKSPDYTGETENDFPQSENCPQCGLLPSDHSDFDCDFRFDSQTGKWSPTGEGYPDDFEMEAKTANSNAGGWSVGGGKPMEIEEDGGRLPELAEAHAELEDNTSITRPATTDPIKLNQQQTLKTAGAPYGPNNPPPVDMHNPPDDWIDCSSCEGTHPPDFHGDCRDDFNRWPSAYTTGEKPMEGASAPDQSLHHLNKKFMGSKSAAGEMSVSSAVKKSESIGNDLKKMYLDAKALTDVNDTRAVREAVEMIFRAADAFDEATKALNKQKQQEEAEAEAQEMKAKNKKSSFGGLAIAAGE